MEISARDCHCTPVESSHADPDLLDLQRRAAAQGLNIRLPTAGPDWELPEPVEVEGELASEALIRLRRANRP